MPEYNFVKIVRSPVSEKKWRVYLNVDGKEHHVDFGAKGYDDFTTHGDEKRKRLYLMRHAAREDWKKSGLLTPGFWAKHLLWSKPTIKESLDDVIKKFNLQ